MQRLLSEEVYRRQSLELELRELRQSRDGLNKKVKTLERQLWRAPALKAWFKRLLRRSKPVVVQQAARMLQLPPQSGGLLHKGTLGDLSDHLVLQAMDRLERLPIFKAAEYLDFNPDVKNDGMDPRQHAVCYGLLEGRAVFQRKRIARVLGDAAVTPLTLETPSVPLPVRGLGPVGVFTSSHGNIFMHEIAEGLATDLRRAGVEAAVYDETLDIDARPPVCIFVAPHEFFVLGSGRRWIRDDVLSSAFVYNTEQAQTPWFNKAVPFMLAARGVIDIVAQTASIFARAGVPALHFEPSARPVQTWVEPGDESHPLFRALPRAAWENPSLDRDWADRPIDVSFFGAESPHREKFFARNAARFAEHSTYFYYRRANVPIRRGTTEAVLTRLAGHVAGHSKVALNVHREEFGYFEWHRVVRQGMCAGAVVVSENGLPHPVFKAGVHYLEGTLRDIPNLVDWLVRSPEGQRKALQIRQAALQVVLAGAEGHAGGLRLAAFLHQHLSA